MVRTNMKPTTTSDLIRQIRNQIREKNTNSITDTELLDDINRAQERAMEVLTRNWPYNYIVRAAITTDSSGLFVLPEDCKGNRILSVEVDRIGSYDRSYILRALNYRDVTAYRNKEYNQQASYPVAYYLQGRTCEVFPKKPTNLHIYYVRNPESLVKDAGSIYDIITKTAETTSPIFSGSNLFNTFEVDGGDFKLTGLTNPDFVVDTFNPLEEDIYFVWGVNVIKIENEAVWTATDASTAIVALSSCYISYDGGSTFISLESEPVTDGTDLEAPYVVTGSKEVLDYLLIEDYDSEEISGVNSYSKDSYFNITDTQTGLIKDSFQIDPSSEYDGDSGLFKLYLKIPLRNKVLNRPISDPSDIDVADLGFEVEDFICKVQGACVPELDTIVENFVIQYAVSEVKRSLGSADYVNERDVLKQFEQDVKRAHVNRDKNYRIYNKSTTFVKGRWRWNNRAN